MYDPEREGLNTVESMAHKRRVIRFAAIDNILRAAPYVETEESVPAIIPEKLPEGVVGMKIREVENAQMAHNSAIEESRASVKDAYELAA